MFQILLYMKFKVFKKASHHNLLDHETFCNTVENGRIRNVDVKIKIINSQCSWIERLYDDKFQERDIISLNLIRKHFGKNFNFQSSLFFDAAMVQNFPKFYKKVLLNWQNYFTSSSDLSPVFYLVSYGTIKIYYQ